MVWIEFQDQVRGVDSTDSTLCAPLEALEPCQHGPRVDVKVRLSYLATRGLDRNYLHRHIVEYFRPGNPRRRYMAVLAYLDQAR